MMGYIVMYALTSIGKTTHKVRVKIAKQPLIVQMGGWDNGSLTFWWFSIHCFSLMCRIINNIKKLPLSCVYKQYEKHK